MIEWRYVLVQVSITPGQRPRTRLAELMTRSKVGMPPWECEVMFFSRVTKRPPRSTRVKVSNLLAGWPWRPSEAQLRATRKSLPVSV